MSTKQLVTIGQRWERNRGKGRWTVKGVWRADREVLLVSDDLDVTGRETITVSFANLRRYYTLLP